MGFEAPRTNTFVQVNYTPTTWANKPANPVAGTTVMISDIGPSGSLWRFNTVWRPVGDQVCLATLDTIQSGITNTNTTWLKLFTAALPASFLRITDVLRVYISFIRSGTTDLAAMRAYVGTTGSVSDTSIFSNNVISSTNISAQTFFDFRIEDATHWQLMPRTDLGSGGQTTTAVAGQITTPNISTAGLIVSVGGSSAGTTNTVSIYSASVWLLRSPN